MDSIAVGDLLSHTTHDQLGAPLSASRLLTPSIELDAFLRVIAAACDRAPANISLAFVSEWMCVENLQAL